MAEVYSTDYKFDERSASKDIYSNKDLFNDILKRCHFYTPGWNAISWEEFSASVVVTPISGGLTNLLHVVKLPSAIFEKFNVDESCVVRVFGRSEFTNRGNERVIVGVVSDCRLSETIHHEWYAGRIASYIPGLALMPEQFASAQCAPVVARRLGQLHALDMSVLKKNQETPISEVTTTMEQYTTSWTQMSFKTNLYNDYKKALVETPELFTGVSLKTVDDIKTLPANLRELLEPHFSYRSSAVNDEIPGQVIEELRVPTRDEQMQLMALIDVDRIEEEDKWLSAKCRELGLTIDFCHNDCHGYNCMYQIASETDGLDEDRCVLIDYEYAGLNFRGFDLANSIVETTIRYTGPYPSFRIDFERQANLLSPYSNPTSGIPYSDFEKNFIGGFMEGYATTVAENALPNPLNPALDASFDDLAMEAAWLQLGTNLQWTIWNIPLADNTAIAFGYLEYAVIRLCMYLHWKEKLLALEASRG